MKTATVRQFRDCATSSFKQEEPVIVTRRRGKIVGFFLRALGEALPLEIKKDLFSPLTDEIRASMRNHHLTEGAILADFEKTSKARRRR